MQGANKGKLIGSWRRVFLVIVFVAVLVAKASSFLFKMPDRNISNAAPLSSGLAATFVRAHCSAAPSLSFVSVEKVHPKAPRFLRLFQASHGRINGPSGSMAIPAS